MEYLLGIDVGTSACKTVVFDTGGCVVRSAECGYAVNTPKAGYAEQDPLDWWRAVCKCTKKIAETFDMKKISAVGTDGISWSAAALDSEGEPLCPTPIWMDTRAAKICGEYKKRIGEENIFNLCGNPLQPGYSTGKIIWYKRNFPSMYKKINKVLQANSYIAYKLTGNMTHDASQGYGYHFYDIRNNRWDERMAGAFGINLNLIPDLIMPWETAGRISRTASIETGLPEGLIAVAGGLDAACGTLGAGVHKNLQTQEQGGQAGGMSICTDSYKPHKKLITGRHVVPGCFLLQGGTVGGGGALAWCAREFFGGEADAYETINEMAEKIIAGSNGLIFLPYMSGERSPIWDSDAQGVFFGLGYEKTRAHMARAVMEGVAFSLLHNLQTANETGSSPATLYSSGGAAKSRLWTQIKADVTAVPVAVPSAAEATALGAALLAGVGAGIYKNFDEAVSKTVSVSRIHEPDRDAHERYMKFYEIYLELYGKLKKTMKKIKRPLL
ncbi:MAG: FGGY family carbohydrate kinase [Defluviitaleaceae bacterium]|nr:FGGY family carbohydrate kinase [Defluviitaleaceae bacterium]